MRTVGERDHQNHQVRQKLAKRLFQRRLRSRSRIGDPPRIHHFKQHLLAVCDAVLFRLLLPRRRVGHFRQVFACEGIDDAAFACARPSYKHQPQRPGVFKRIQHRFDARIGIDIVEHRPDDLTAQRQFCQPAGNFLPQAQHSFQPQRVEPGSEVQRFLFVAEGNVLFRMRQQLTPFFRGSRFHILEQALKLCHFAGTTGLDPGLCSLAHRIGDGNADRQLHRRKRQQSRQCLAGERGPQRTQKPHRRRLRYVHAVQPAQPDDHIHFIGHQGHRSDAWQHDDGTGAGRPPPAQVLRLVVQLGSPVLAIVHSITLLRQLLHDLHVGRAEDILLQLRRTYPADLLVHHRRQRPGHDFRLEKGEHQFPLLMRVARTAELAAHPDIDAQLLLALPHDTLLQRLARLQLAAGKLPQERQFVVMRPLADQIFPFLLNNRRRHLHLQFIPPPVCSFS